jgi:hypothetical protein
MGGDALPADVIGNNVSVEIRPGSQTIDLPLRTPGGAAKTTNDS